MARWLICVVAVLTLLSSAAFAAPTRAQRARAEMLRRSADRSLRTGDYAQAIALLEEAYREAPEAKILLDIATAYDEWGDHCPAALEAFKRFFEDCGSCALLEGAKSEHLLVQNRCASDVTVETKPPGAVVQIQSDDWGRVTPFTARLRPGRYLLEIRRYGHLSTTREIEVAAASAQSFSVTLERAPGVTDEDLTIRDPRQPAIEPARAPPVEPEPPGLSGWVVAGIGAGVAGGIVGSIFAFAALDDVDEEVQLRYAAVPDDAAIDDKRSSASRNAALAYVGFGISLVGFAGSIIAHYALETDAPAPVTSTAPSPLTLRF